MSNYNWLDQSSSVLELLQAAEALLDRVAFIGLKGSDESVALDKVLRVFETACVPTVWSVEDVLNQDDSLSHEQCLEVLDNLVDRDLLDSDWAAIDYQISLIK